MSRQSFSLNGHTLEIEREMIEVTSNLPRPNPKWKYTDAAGHPHIAVGIADRVAYPTLELVTVPHDHGEICEETGCPRAYQCPQCEEVISPAVVYDHGSRMIPGLTSYVLDGEHIPPAQAQAFIESWQRQADDRSSRRAQADREAGYL